MNLLIITNDLDLAKIADLAGVDEIFVDLEIQGKEERQADRNTVISHHVMEDVSRIKNALTSASLLVRCNPVGPWTVDEIDEIVERGADVIMLPYFKTEAEVKTFIDCVAGRVRTCLLVETLESLEILDSILEIEGVNRVHIGLNDIHIASKSKFMFEPFSNGLLDDICKILRMKGVPFGIGGIGRVGSSLKPSPEGLLAEHRRLGSSSVILARSFRDWDEKSDITDIKIQLSSGVNSIRQWCSELDDWTMEMFKSNQTEVAQQIEKVVNKLSS